MDRKPIAVVLVSGGMDSCVTAAEANASGHALAFLHGNYGQRTEARELACFHAIADRLGVPRALRLVVDLPHLGVIGGSSLTDRSMPVEISPLASGPGRAGMAGGNGSLPSRRPGAESPWTRPGPVPSPPRMKPDNDRAEAVSFEASSAEVGSSEAPSAPGGAAGHGTPPEVTARAGAADAAVGAGRTRIPTSYVPFRNAHFLAAAVSWGETLAASAIYIGAVEEDSSGYPDCREEYFRAFERVIELGTRPETRLRIVTPLIHLDKAGIVRRGLELDAPFELTWSCYSENDVACGACDSCALRLRGFARAGAVDPIPYAARNAAST